MLGTVGPAEMQVVEGGKLTGLSEKGSSTIYFRNKSHSETYLFYFERRVHI